MNLTLLLALIAIAVYLMKSREQRRRIALLASYLGKYQIESLMESLTQGYLRALGEGDPQRRAQIWSMLETAEVTLREQFNRFVADFSKVEADHARVSKFAFAMPYADVLFASATFDMRAALEIHAQGLARATNNVLGQDQKSKAFTVSAELFLMQHTCHWFCRSKTVASARMLAQHKTPYTQLLASVAPETRRVYTALVAG